MTERELLRAIGEIDEKYIEEAAPSTAVKVVLPLPSDLICRL